MGENKENKLSKRRKYVGELIADYNVYTGPGTKNDILEAFPKLFKGNLVDVCDEVKNAGNKKWYYVRIGGKHYGWVLANKIVKV